MSKKDAFGGIEREVRVIMNRVRRISVENAHRIDPELSVPAYGVLFFLWDNGPVRAQDIVRAIGSDKGTVSRQIAQLIKLGLVTRSPHEVDRRAQAVSLTEEGQRRIDEVANQRRADYVARLSDWSVESLTKLAVDLARYNEALESMAQANGAR